MKRRKDSSVAADVTRAGAALERARPTPRSRASGAWSRTARLALTLTAFALPALAPAATLDDVRARGVVRCGVNAGLAGFSTANSLGVYSGFDVDLCRAIAAAVFRDEEAVEPVPTTSVDRFDDLEAGRFEVLSRNTTWTLDRNARYGQFVGTSFYDGQGFMARKRSGVRSALELDGRRICVGRGTTSELNAADFFDVAELRYRPVYYDDQGGAFDGYVADECDAVTTDRSALAAQRSAFETPAAHLVLPEIISKEPLGPVVRAGDAEWENVVRWTLNCMINAEELGITSAAVDSPASRATPAARRLLGLEGEAGEALGLEPEWCANIVALVGNYGEVYERHVGPDTPIALPRGVNALWTDGGLIYAPPIR